MRLLLKVLALLILGPIALGLTLLLGIAAIVGIPLLWDRVSVRFSAPPPEEKQPSTGA